MESNNLVLRRYAPIDATVTHVTDTHYYFLVGLRPVAVPHEQVFTHEDFPIEPSDTVVILLVSEWACDKLNINYDINKVITTGRKRD